MLLPCVNQNASERSKCHTLRGKTLIKLNLLKPALADLEIALNLTPECIELQSIVKEIKEKLEKNVQQKEQEEKED